MIDVHYVQTNNGQKVTIMLEEIGLDYQLVVYDIFNGDHHTPAFRRINPNNKLPAIVDHEPIGGGGPLSVFESGAILLYLAEKSGKLMPMDPAGRSRAQQWLMWQSAGLGPMMGQAHHFVRYAPEELEYAIGRYRREVARLLDVLEYRLREAAYLAGDEYSVADIMVWCWAHPQAASMVGVDPGGRPATADWYARIGARRAVQKAMSRMDAAIPAHYQQQRAVLTPEQWSVMFGERMTAAARPDQAFPPAEG